MSPWYEFSCPDCEAAFAVDGAAREKVLEAGCVNCGASVAEEAFERRDAVPQTST